MPKVDIYIKIRFHGNPRGTGIAAAIAECTYRGVTDTRTATSGVSGTENRLALAICTDALHLLKKPCSVTFHIDNGYVRHTAANGWAWNWKENGWRKPDGKAPANAGEWQQLLSMCRGHSITWKPYDGKYDNELDNKLDSMEGGGR